jgi:hypothetical protein
MSVGLGEGRLGDIDPELEQFGVDARRTPKPIGQAHLQDQAGISPGILGRPSRLRDFQRRYSRTTFWYYWMTVSGWTIVTASNTDRNKQ